MQDAKRELIHLGLSEKEADVYTAALEVGPAVVQDIAKRAKVNRATTYVMIESLSARGLVSTFTKGKKRFFAAETPDRLLSILRLQQRELQEKEQELEEVMPMLQAMHSMGGEKPKVRYLEGSEGLKTAQEVIEKKTGDYVTITNASEVLNLFEVGELREHRSEVMKKQKSGSKVLMLGSKEECKQLIDVFEEEIQYRCLPEDKFNVHGEISVRGDIIVMLSIKTDIFGVIIESQMMADSMRSLIELAWQGAEDIEQK